MDKEEAYAKRRQEVDRLLKEGTNEKLLRGRTHEAFANILKAYRLAHKKDIPLNSPWRPLTSYRLAHLLLRKPNLNRLKLLDIDSYLKEACEEESLGSWPRLFRLATLHRLDILGERDLSKTISSVFESASRKVRDELSAESRDYDVRNKSVVQLAYFNVLELCQYFLSLDSYQLEGLGSPYNDIGYEGWRIVGKSFRLADILYPEALAKSELANLAEQVVGKDESAIIFLFSKSRAVWRLNAGKWSCPKNKSTIELIARIFLNKADEFEDRVNNKSTWRSIRKRCREDLSRLTGYTPRDFLGNNSDLVFPDELSFFGALEDSAL